MSEENKATVTGYHWVDPELLLGEAYPDNVDDTKCIIERHEHKDAYLFCPKCKKVDPVPVCIDVNITNNHPLVKVYTKGLSVKAQCDECNSDMVALDRYMAEPVELLSNAGYGVVSCSQGNVTAIPGDREDVPEELDYFLKFDTNPYIKFDKDYPDLDKMKLPVGWFFDKEPYCETEEVKNADGTVHTETTLKQTKSLKYGIPDEMINYELMSELETDEPLLTMDGFAHLGYGVPCKELTKSIKEFLDKK